MADEEDFKPFQTVIDVYEKGRPQFSKESVEFLLNQVGILPADKTRVKTILELGAGTGIFTRAMLATLKEHNCNAKIIASDPMKNMRQKFRVLVPGVEILPFAAENIELPDSSVDVVISAQAFHWFANKESVAEISRVLVPRGTFGMIWNTRDFNEPWVFEIRKIITPCSLRNPTPNNLDNKWKNVIESSLLFGPLHGSDDAFKLQHKGNMEDILNVYRCLHAITCLAESERLEVEDKIRKVLTSHPDLEGLTEYSLPYITPLYWCEKSE